MNVKVEKMYTLENVSHEDIENIIVALEYYKKSFPRKNGKLLKELSSLISVKSVSPASETRYLLEGLRPFDTLMIPDEIFPGCGNNGTVCWFFKGKSSQINLSRWANRDAFDEKKPALQAMFINSYCADLLKTFLASEGTYAGKYAKPTKSGHEWFVECYIDNKGKVTDSKSFSVSYHADTKETRIIKDDTFIYFSEIETICLEEFLISNVEVKNG